jgi:C-terminal processing protease CtpA/Prc
VDSHRLKGKFSPEGYGPSDHAPFYAADIPVLFFSAAVHQTYHTPDDDVDGLNFKGMWSIAELVYDLILDLANRSEAMVFQEAGPKTRSRMRHRLKVTLGIMPDYASSDVKGLRAQMITPGRPAAQAGMEKGDIIVAMDGKPVNDIYEYMHRLNEFRPGQRISVEVIRNEERIILIVEL